MKEKIGDLNEANADLGNLFAATEIATIFLDRDLHIRRFTPSAVELLHVIPGDIGRPIADLTLRFQSNNIAGLAHQVLQGRAQMEKEVQTPEGRWHLMHVLPYRAADERVAGVVITFIDVTSMKRTEQAIQQARRFAESIIATIREPLLVLDAELRVVSASASYFRTFGGEPKTTEGVAVTELNGGLWKLPALLEHLRVVGAREAETAVLEDVELEREVPGRGRRSLLLNARRFVAEGETGPLVLLAIEDVTERKRVRLAEAMVSEVSHRTKNNLAIVAGLLQLQADRHAGAEESTHLIRDAITRIRAFAALYEQVQVGPGEQIEVVEAVRRIAEIAQGVLAVRDTDIAVEGAPVSYPFEVGTNLTVVANELITNALKHGAPDPMGALRIRIEVESRDGKLRLSVWNSGNPVADDLNLAEASATGLYLVQSVVVDNYGGEFHLQSHRGGTRAEVVIPEEYLLGEGEA